MYDRTNQTADSIISPYISEGSGLKLFLLLLGYYVLLTFGIFELLCVYVKPYSLSEPVA